MFAALLIVFREVIEAGLIIGIVMAATKNVAGRARWISGGVVAGLFGAVLLALGVEKISAAMAGVGQEIFNAAILSFAVVMLAWHNIWMARHGRALSLQFKELGSAVSEGTRSLLALALVVGIAVLREGAEIVLFLYGVALSAGAAGVPEMLLGGFLGLALGAALGFATYWGLLKVPTRHVFAVTGALIALLAAGMAATAVGYLQQADIVDFMAKTAWNSSNLLAQDSLLGTLLHALIGYTAQPTQAQVVTYAATLAIIFVLMRLCAPRPMAVTVRS
jgi:high-affinity iron transporter